MEINLSRLSSTGSVVSPLALVVNFPRLYIDMTLSSTNQISFLLARCDVIVTTSGRRFTPSDSRCLSGNKTGESSSRRCWKLFNEFTNRLIVDEIFWSRLMNFSIRFLQVFYVSSTEHDISCSPNWPLALTRVRFRFLETLMQSFPPPVAQLFKYVPKLLEYSSSLERISTFFRDELKLSPQNLIRMKKKFSKQIYFIIRRIDFPCWRWSRARLFVKLGDRKSS